MRSTKAKIERFSIECRETKTKVIAMANHNKRKQELKANTRNRREVWGNTCDQVAIAGLNWFWVSLVGWEGGASFFKLIIESSKAILTITFYSQLKTALYVN